MALGVGLQTAGHTVRVLASLNFRALITAHGLEFFAMNDLTKAMTQERVRELAEQVGVTERRIQMIVNDLEDGGYLIRHRTGRRTRYQVLADRPFRHSLETGRSVDELLAIFDGSDRPPRAITAG